MITAITMNPSIDISYVLDDFILDTVNRVDRVNKTAGGKGLNVARIINLTQNNVISTGLIGGKTGNFLQEQLDKESVNHDFFSIECESRNCIAILHKGLQTEILESGPIIKESEQNEFKSFIKEKIISSDVITISGSLPKGMPTDFYSNMIDISCQYGKKLLLDCSGETLIKSITSKNKPYLIKPNNEELSMLSGRKNSS